MQKWIQKELNIRCHPTRLWVICDETRGNTITRTTTTTTTNTNTCTTII